MFNLSPKWNFPSNNHSQIIGIADSGVEMFKGTPIKSLAREICQNSLDARLDDSQPARIEFETFEIDPKNIPGAKTLEDVFNRCLDFWKIQDSDQARKFFKQAIKDMNRSSIKCLRISDFNTSGLTGSRAEYNSPWCNLTKSSGTSNKSGGRGGSFGIGKFAPFACSSLRTVFYSTYDINKTSASQGVARLTTFKNKKNETTQGIGFYGDDKNSPTYNQYSLNPTYSRLDNTGTDIFIAGFTGEKGWDHQMVASILDGFLYAIYTGALVVDVDGIAISKDTLSELMVSHKDYFKEHADEYYRVLTDNENARSFTLELKDDPATSGTLTLRLMIEPTFNRRVAMIRQTGMKIKDKGNINGIVPFAGTLLIEGDAINSYLRNLENPQHLAWEKERADNKAQYGKLQICPFVVAVKDLNGYSSSDFHDDYQGEVFDIEAGCVLAVGKMVVLDITKNTDDIANTPSIFSITRNPDTSCHQMLVDMSQRKIMIKLPWDDFTNYSALQSLPEAQSILNSLTVVPALVYVLGQLRAQSPDERNENNSDTLWYKVLSKTLSTKFDCEIESTQFDALNFMELAQKLVNDPLSDAFKFLVNSPTSSGGEDE